MGALVVMMVEREVTVTVVMAAVVVVVVAMAAREPVHAFTKSWVGGSMRVAVSARVSRDGAVTVCHCWVTVACHAKWGHRVVDTGNGEPTLWPPTLAGNQSIFLGGRERRWWVPIASPP